MPTSTSEIPTTLTQTLTTISPTPPIASSSHLGKSTLQWLINMTQHSSEVTSSLYVSSPKQLSPELYTNVATTSTNSSEDLKTTKPFTNYSSPTERILTSSGIIKNILPGTFFL